MEHLLMSPSVDFKELDQLVHQFKGSSASLGAHQLALLCVSLRKSCLAQNVEVCRNILVEVQSGFIALKARLDAFLLLERQQKHLSTQLGM